MFSDQVNTVMTKHAARIGYAASAVVVFSFLFSDYDLRVFLIVNTTGAILFILYGFSLGKNWPIIIPNIFIFCLNLYKLLFSIN